MANAPHDPAVDDHQRIDPQPIVAYPVRDEEPRARPALILLVTLLLLAAVVTIYIVFSRAGHLAEGSGDRPALAQRDQSGNGDDAGSFNLEPLVIPGEAIFSGGPAKDGIPALTDPPMLRAAQADYLHPDDRVIGVYLNGQARAYPLNVLNYHEVVNDQLGDTSIAVTYCPLCDSAAVFDRQTPLGQRDFGVSGLLFNSNVLLYDRTSDQQDSLWSQMRSAGVSGAAADKALRALPMELTTWYSWSMRYPETQVLSRNTGHARNYDANPYEFYFSVPELMFPVEPLDDRLPLKQRVLGVWSGQTARAYPLSAFGRDATQIEQQIEGRSFSLNYEPSSSTLRVVSADPDVQWMYSLWFAWYAFHPETEVYER